MRQLDSITEQLQRSDIRIFGLEVGSRRARGVVLLIAVLLFLASVVL
jgi:hypothetical protein